MCFEELKTSRLDETTYTIDEVTDMLDGLLSVVRGEVEDLLENIAEFEEENFRGTKRDTDLNSVLKNVKLVPLNETGGTSLLHGYQNKKYNPIVNMQEEHRQSLKRNYVQLVKETPTDLVVDHLYQNGILTDEMREEILQNSNSYSKTRQLITTLQRRGPRAFECFCTALTDEGKSSLVHLLKESKIKSEVSKDRAMLPIGGDIFVVVNEWRDKVLIHIHKYEKNSADVYVPTKKGIALDLNQWQLLEMYVNEIEEAISQMIDDVTGVPEMTFHLGRGVYVSVNKTYPTVDVRQRWKIPETNQIVSTKKGISLTYDKWEALKGTFPDVRETVPEIETTTPCILSEDHQNQEGMLMCSNCNPFAEPL
ncbi:LZTFL1 [Mytilus edulis]|uniref:LZTFL1 n=2 Tax=Mytilus TaxID=6548 RepID=A0A8S3R0U7_MYTED|nr:LZTFL1 [Mytilus edulis]